MSNDPMKIDWKIGRQGRAWDDDEAMERFELLLETNIEMLDGKVFLEDDTRLLMVGLLLENLGVDAVVKLGDPAVWREAVSKLP